MRFSTIASCLVGSLAVASALPTDPKAVNSHNNSDNIHDKKQLKITAQQLLNKALRQQKVRTVPKDTPSASFSVSKSKIPEEDKSAEPATYYRDQLTEEQHKHLLDAFEDILAQDDEKKAEAQVTASVLAYLNDFLTQDDEENQDRKTMNVFKHLLALQSEQAHSINVPLPQLVSAKGGAVAEGQIGTAYDVQKQQQAQQEGSSSEADRKKQTYEKLIQNLDAQLDEIKDAAKEKEELEKLRETYTQKMKEVEDALKEKKEAQQQPQAQAEQQPQQPEQQVPIPIPAPQ